MMDRKAYDLEDAYWSAGSSLRGEHAIDLWLNSANAVDEKVSRERTMASVMRQVVRLRAPQAP